jgi:hypothetical protein
MALIASWFGQRERPYHKIVQSRFQDSVRDSPPGGGYRIQFPVPDSNLSRAVRWVAGGPKNGVGACGSHASDRSSPSPTAFLFCIFRPQSFTAIDVLCQFT